METSARYLLIGLLALAAIAGGFLFVYWLNNTGGLGQRAQYRVEFDGPTPGLITGSPVLFNGLRVGEVVSVGLDPAQPRQVRATIAVDAATPVRTDTEVGLTFQGLTGATAVALTGGTGAPPAPSASGEPPLLVAGVAASQDTMQAAREAIQHLDRILSDNAEPLKNAIANISTFSDSLARNSDRIDRIAAGLERTFGGTAEKPVPGSFSLTPPARFPPIARLPQGQLAVAEPTALILFDTQRILVRSGDVVKPAFEDWRWSDTLPLLVQATLVRAFENAGYRGASPASAGLTVGYQLLVDIRDFVVAEDAQPAASVELGGKILDDKGGLVGAQVFRATAPVAGTDAAGAATALNEAFGKAAADMVVWTLGAME